MTRRELRQEIWQALQPVLNRYRAANRCGLQHAVSALTAEVRNVFPLFRGVHGRRKKMKARRKLLTKSEWKPQRKGLLECFGLKPRNTRKVVRDGFK